LAIEQSPFPSFWASAKKRSASINARMRTFDAKIGGFTALPIDLSAYVEMNKKIFIFSGFWF